MHLLLKIQNYLISRTAFYPFNVMIICYSDPQSILDLHVCDCKIVTRISNSIAIGYRTNPKSSFNRDSQTLYNIWFTSIEVMDDFYIVCELQNSNCYTLKNLLL